MKSGPFDLRGSKLGGVSYSMWNTDAFGYGRWTDPLYASVPFYLVLRDGRAHGVFLDNTHRSHFDLGREHHRTLSIGADGGDLDLYVIAGPTPDDVLRRYTALTGRVPLPPLWALGYHQCRYSYYPESAVRFLARNFRERSIPADAIWLDIHYQDGYAPFTWDAERFPDPADLVADLRAEGFRTVVIVDPHPEADPEQAVYASGLAGDHFVRRADGEVLEAEVWPSQAEVDPGPSVFPDFARADTRRWWGEQYSYLVDLGVAGIWNDMNEPAVFDAPNGTLPLDAVHRADLGGEARATDHREIHNVYGQLMTRATRDGLRRLRPDARPFVLTRATYAGGQRWAAIWPGDNHSSWADLRASLPMLLGLGLSGLGHSGVDVGGFAGSADGELFTRWLQSAVFYPFLRAHTALGTDPQDPWSYGTRFERANRAAIELRYRLLPHIYTVMREMSRTGAPALRPVFFEFPGDSTAAWNAEQYLFGADLLVAPVLEPGATERWLRLPAATWYDLATGERVEGDRWHRVDVGLETLPVFARAGAVVASQPVVQHTGEMPGQPRIFTVYPDPAGPSERTIYEDAGDGFEHESGAFLERVVRHWSEPSEKGDTLIVEVDTPSGTWRPAARDLVLRVPVDALGGSPGDTPPAVTLDGESVEAKIDAGFLEIRVEERFDAPRRLVIRFGSPGLQH